MFLLICISFWALPYFTAAVLHNEPFCFLCAYELNQIYIRGVGTWYKNQKKKHSPTDVYKCVESFRLDWYESALK